MHVYIYAGMHATLLYMNCQYIRQAYFCYNHINTGLHKECYNSVFIANQLTVDNPTTMQCLNMNWIIALSLAIGMCTVSGRIQEGPSVDVKCLATNCESEVQACFGTKECLELMACERGCWSEFDNDMTPEKAKFFNCTSACQFSYLYKKQVTQDFLGCAVKNSCLKDIPAIPSTCHTSVKPSQKLSAKDLVGDWWVVRGLHPVFDCYDCQYFGYTMSGSDVKYTASFKAPLANGSVATISQEFDMPTAPAGQGIKFTYDDAGVMLTDTWYLLDKATDGSYVVVYYCGSGLTFNYEGGVVLSRKTSLPADAYSKISSTYNSTVGISLSKFCSPRADGCSKHAVIY